MTTLHIRHRLRGMRTRRQWHRAQEPCGNQSDDSTDQSCIVKINGANLTEAAVGKTLACPHQSTMKGTET